MGPELTDEEIKNLIIVTVEKALENLHFPENGVELQFLANEAGIDTDTAKIYIQKMIQEKLLTWRFDEAKGEKYFINPTEKAIKELERLNALTMHETTKIVMEKLYDIYKRYDYDSTIQFHTVAIGGYIGISNTAKVNSAVEILKEQGYIGDLARMAGTTVFMLSARGINMIEKATGKYNDNDEQITQSPIIVNNSGGNVAINSPNAKQSVNNNQLLKYFEIMEKLIKENLKEDEKANALTNLETIQELSKVDPPNKPLIQTILNNLDKIPILFEIANKIREWFSYIKT